MKLLDWLRQIKSDVILLSRACCKISAIKIKQPDIKVHTYKSLVKTIVKRNDTCHVIATGYSAIDSFNRKIVRDKDYIIGFNFAAFLPYKFDLYFCEEISSVNGTGGQRRTNLQVQLLKHRLNNISNVVFKNIYYAKVSQLSSINNELIISLMLDKHIATPNVKALFAAPFVFMPQYASTVITCVITAYHAGFKNIVVHGLDFSGPHIYNDDELQKQVNIEAPTPYVPSSVKHSTTPSQELIWKNLIKELNNKGVNIFCASEQSNFRQYAPIYNS